MTFGSLFSGIGGLDLGLERAGMECRWQVEIDPYATKVLEKHWPHVKRYSDVRTVGDDLERVGLICGGFPCQDISVAGKRAGINGDRSGLWAEYARIVRVLRPRFVLVENVAALLGRGLGRVLGDLAACGYDAEWDCLPASLFGAPHERDRIFLVAYPGEISRECRVLSDRQDEIPRDPQWSSAKGIESGRQWKRWLIAASAAVDGQIAGADFHRVGDGVPEGMDRIECLGNAVVPQVAEWIGRRIIESETH